MPVLAHSRILPSTLDRQGVEQSHLFAMPAGSLAIQVWWKEPCRDKGGSTSLKQFFHEASDDKLFNIYYSCFGVRTSISANDLLEK